MLNPFPSSLQVASDNETRNVEGPAAWCISFCRDPSKSPASSSKESPTVALALYVLLSLSQRSLSLAQGVRVPTRRPWWPWWRWVGVNERPVSLSLQGRPVRCPRSWSNCGNSRRFSWIAIRLSWPSLLRALLSSRASGRVPFGSSLPSNSTYLLFCLFVNFWWFAFSSSYRYCLRRGHFSDSCLSEIDKRMKRKVKHCFEYELVFGLKVYYHADV